MSDDTLVDRRKPLLFIHSSIDDMTDLSPNAMRVYMHLCRRANGNGVAWPSYQTMGDHCFASVSDKPATRKTFARNAIDELIKAGLILKEERVREDGGQSSNVYVITEPSMGVLLSTGGAYKGTAHAYKAPEGNPSEGNPSKVIKDDDDNGRKREHAAVFDAWAENITGTMTGVLGEKLHDLIDECGSRSVIHGIVASVEANVRNFKYVAACARNHAAGKEAPVKQQRGAPNHHRKYSGYEEPKKNYRPAEYAPYMVSNGEEP